MYGLVNQGIKDLVLSRFGEESWLALCQEAGTPTDFVSMDYYDDRMTYSLVGAASKLLQVPPEKILADFGQYWVHYTAQEGYGPIMSLFGSDFKMCLKNLNQLHARMGMSLPQLNPPSFEFEEKTEDSFHLFYQSNRKGLAPMVVGLLEGLATKFGHKITVEAEPMNNGTLFKIHLVGRL